MPVYDVRIDIDVSITADSQEAADKIANNLAGRAADELTSHPDAIGLICSAVIWVEESDETVED